MKINSASKASAVCCAALMLSMFSACGNADENSTENMSESNISSSDTAKSDNNAPGETPEGEAPPDKPEGGEPPQMPDGNDPPDMPGGGQRSTDNGTAANTIDSDTVISQENYTSSADDENALRISGAKAELSGITVKKTGSSTNTESGDFYGMNAAVLALDGANVVIKNGDIFTDGINSNGIFSYGKGTEVSIYDTVIRTTERNSGGIQTTGGGTTNAYDLDIETQGASSAAIRSDRGGGNVDVKGGTYVTNGTGSPAIYSTADIEAENAVLTANSSEGAVVEGKNSISLDNCVLTGNMKGTYNDPDENIHNIMIYQSMSGDAEVGKAEFSAEGGSITALAGDMFYVTNTSCEIELERVEFTLANDTFLRVEGNDSSRGWGNKGENGGIVDLETEDQKINGNIYVDEISSLDMTLGEGSEFTGSINPDGEAGEVTVHLESGSRWTLTADSYITRLDGDISDVDTNGFSLNIEE